MTDSLLELHSLSRSFSTSKGDVHALQNIDVTINEGELVTVIGPSGCGKSTLLKIIAGLDKEYTGSLLLNGNPITEPGTNKGFIFQEPRLFPWLNVEKNIAADLSLRDPTVKADVQELIELVRLDGFEKAYPKELSGGMAQRVSIARALLRKPKILLLDEPFGALDAFTRSHMQEVLLEIWERNRTTMVFVTHDIDEAIFLANRVIILKPRPGEIKKMMSTKNVRLKGRTSPEFQAMRSEALEELEDLKFESNKETVSS